jgi:hypothetical protein
MVPYYLPGRLENIFINVKTNIILGKNVKHQVVYDLLALIF